MVFFFGEEKKIVEFSDDCFVVGIWNNGVRGERVLWRGEKGGE